MFVVQLPPKLILSVSTAILVFAQSTAADARLKRLAGQPLPNRSVLAQLTRRTRQIAGATALPVLHSTDLITHTGRFGEQMTAALHVAFARGFERVLVVGNDCPALTTAHLTQAAHALQSASVVLGPDQRGGLYLFGLSRAAFENLPLAEMPWQTNRLAQTLGRTCTDWTMAVLPRLNDVNSRADLQQYQTASLLTSAFIRHLLAIGVDEYRVETGSGLVRAVRILLRTGALRGPPVPTGTASLAAVAIAA